MEENILANILQKKNHITVRLGWTELRYVENWLKCKQNKSYPNYLLSHPEELQFIKVMGVFPHEDKDMISFLDTYSFVLGRLQTVNRDSVSYAITLDSDFYEKLFFDKNTKFKASIFNPLRQVGVFQKELAKKKLCIVTPFPESIKKQLNKLNLLFDDGRFTNIDPDNVQFIKCPPHKEISNEIENPYPTWGHALQDMILKLNSIDYDILLTGCGSYSLPLNYKAFIDGKNALNLGGDLQLMFGVVGGRWKSQPEHYKFNEHWISPLDEERPSGYFKIEHGAYW
jgi:hypothetical protein